MKTVFFWVRIVIACLLGFNALVFVMACVEYGRASPGDNIMSAVRETSSAKASGPAVILIHGFGGSPYDFRYLARDLSEKNYNVIAPVTPFQTRDTFAYARGQYSSEDYIRWVRDLVRKEYEKTGQAPVLIGFSMGGALSILAGEKLPVRKMVLIAPYLDLSFAPIIAKPMAAVGRWIIPVVPKLNKGRITNREGYAAYQPGSMLVSMSAFHQVENIKMEAQAAFQNLKMPVLMIGSVHDRVASYRTARSFCLMNRNCSFMSVSKSNHIVMFDNDADDVRKKVLEFIGSE